MKNEKILTNFFKALLAGFTIAIGGVTYLAIENSFIGSVMFSFGLLTILYKGWNLYTGKVGYTTSLSLVPPLAITLLGNLAGLTVGAAIYRAVGINEIRLAVMCEKKLSNEWLQVLLLAIMCGVMMYLAVSLFRATKSPLMVIMPISIFIVCGFEHSMASYFFLISYFGFDLPAKFFAYIGIMIVGNAIGSLALAGVEALTREKTEDK
jgi:nitrite transporter NirC